MRKILEHHREPRAPASATRASYRRANGRSRHRLYRMAPRSRMLLSHLWPTSQPFFSPFAPPLQTLPLVLRRRAFIPAPSAPRDRGRAAYQITSIAEETRTRAHNKNSGTARSQRNLISCNKLLQPTWTELKGHRTLRFCQNKKPLTANALELQFVLSLPDTAIKLKVH